MIAGNRPHYRQPTNRILSKKLPEHGIFVELKERDPEVDAGECFLAVVADSHDHPRIDIVHCKSSLEKP